MKIKIYHGTTASKAKSIIGDGNFVFQQRPDHWLGQGVYFFVNDYDAAVWWAGQGQDRDVKRAVLEYELEVDEDDLLDLDTLTGMRKFNEFLNSESNHLTMKLNSTSDKSSMRETRALWLQTFYKYSNVKCCIFSFEVPYTDEFENIKSLGLEIKERQLVAIDFNIIEIQKLIINYI